MQNNNDNNNGLQTEREMLKKILLRRCGNCETDEFAADELELMERLEGRDCECGEDNPEIGDSEYFSTCEYTMIPTDDDAINSQGS